MVYKLFVAIGIALCSFTAHAQILRDPLGSPSASQHIHAPAETNVIDGSKHPELIPDSTAYRLFLVTVAEVTDAPEERKNRQILFLRAAGLDDDDTQAAIGILATFKTQYTDLINRYNESVAEANRNGTKPDIATFLRQRDELVQSTRDSLGQVVSLDGISNLHAHVQREKAKMKVVVKEGQ